MELLLLIVYDIKNDKGREKVSNTLKKYGFERLQYSVFAGSCTDGQWNKWHRQIEKLFAHFCEPEDKLYVIPQSQRLFAKTQMAGTPFDVDWVMGKVQVLYY